MSFAKTEAFQRMKTGLQERSNASREAHAKAMAEAQIENEADAAGTIEMTPEEFAFSMTTGVDPVGVHSDEREEDQ